MESPGRPPRAVLVAIVAGACALRVWGLDYGLPHPQGRPDEEMLVQRLLGFDTGDPNPHWFMYPTFFLYLLYAWVKLALVGLVALGAATGAPLAEWLQRDPATVYVVARALCAVLGTLDVLATF